jgi:anti-sigma factor RsiW
MNCAEFEILLSDYLDGTLSATAQTALEQHMATCSGCREFMQDAAGAVRFAKRVEPVVPPPNLITHIAFYAPASRIRRPLESQGFWSKLIDRWVSPVLQPRFAMGMAMTILSFAMLERCTGVPVQHIQAADLSPVRVWNGVEDRAIRIKDRAAKYYENMRLVYEIEGRIKELQEAPAPVPQSKQAAAQTGIEGVQGSSNHQPDGNKKDQGGNAK